MSRTTARDRTIPVETTACTMRQKRKVPVSGAKIVPSVARRKTASVTSMTGRRPKRSETGPISNCTTADSAR